jgi:dihydroorotase
MRTLIRGGRVIDPATGLDAVRDVLIENRFVTQIGEHINAGDARVIDAAGCIVAPGFIDMHVHLRDPGQTHKETIATGVHAQHRSGA